MWLVTLFNKHDFESLLYHLWVKREKANIHLSLKSHVGLVMIINIQVACMSLYSSVLSPIEKARC